MTQFLYKRLILLQNENEKKAVVFVITALKMKSGLKNVIKNLFQRVLDFGALGQIYNSERKSGTGKMNT